MTSVQTPSRRSWARPAGIAVLGLLLAVAAIVLEEIHFQNVASWIIGEPAPFRLSWFEYAAPCTFVADMIGCRRAVSTDDLLAPILAVSGVTLMAAIAIKRRYRSVRYVETEVQ